MYVRAHVHPTLIDLCGLANASSTSLILIQPRPSQSYPHNENHNSTYVELVSSPHETTPLSPEANQLIPWTCSMISSNDNSEFKGHNT